MNLPLELSQIVGAAAEIEPALAVRPRILVAGEFSSGKTRLVNALLGEALLPSSVTSTSLPPIWITSGEGTPECVGVDGRVQAFGSVPELIGHVLGADLARIHHCRLPHPSPVLRHFDLIDTPGSSDPNIPSLCWERMVDHADMVVWCSTAVQAWRQSEKSAWLAIPEDVAARSLLVLSHADRLTDPADREKVLRRVTHEAEGLFASIRLASFLSEPDVAGLLADLHAAAAGLPRRPSRPFLPAPEGDAAGTAAAGDGGAAPRVVPRRIRLRSSATAPLLLVTRAPEAEIPSDDLAAEADAPIVADEAIGIDEAPAFGPDDAGPLLPQAAAPAAETAPGLPDVFDLASLASAASVVDHAPLPPGEPAGGEEGFLALLRGAIEAVEDVPEADPPAPAPDAATAGPDPDSSEAADPACARDIGDAGDGPAEAIRPTDRDTVPPVGAVAAGLPTEEAAPVPVAARMAAPQPAPMIFGPARMLWAQILPTLDADDPDQLLDGIEQLVAELDLTWARACLAQAPTVGRRRGGAAGPA